LCNTRVSIPGKKLANYLDVSLLENLREQSAVRGIGSVNEGRLSVENGSDRVCIAALTRLEDVESHNKEVETINKKFPKRSSEYLPEISVLLRL